jgi:formate dehydrogenase iron-sulfur subunit
MSRGSQAPTISRRAFIKGGLAAAGLAAGATTANAALSPGDTHLATLIDISRCIGCGECVAACHEANAAENIPQPQKAFSQDVPAPRQSGRLVRQAGGR